MWKRSGCQRQKTEYGKRRKKRISFAFSGKSGGQIEMAVGMFGIFMITMVMFVGLKIAQFMVTGAYVEDALAASNLASALIDVEEFGKSRIIRIKEPIAAYECYKEALSQNLMLDEEGRSFQRQLLVGLIQVKAYIIYNVEGEVVQIISFTEGRNEPNISFQALGKVHTPDGVLVETTTIYSKVKFQVKGIGEMHIQAEKEKSVDIKRKENYE